MDSEGEYTRVGAPSFAVLEAEKYLHARLMDRTAFTLGSPVSAPLPGLRNTATVHSPAMQDAPTAAHVLPPTLNPERNRRRMLEAVSLSVVLLTGVFLVGLAVTALVIPAQATEFLKAFAGSARTHYLEMALRAVAGAAFIAHGPRMWAGNVFVVWGWLLLLTTLVLALLPWRWHRAFAHRVIPSAIRLLRLFGLVTLLCGIVVLTALAIGAEQ